MALALLTLMLAIGPLARLSPRFLPLSDKQGHMGATCFLLALVHATLLTVWHHRFGDLDPLMSLLGPNTRCDSLQGFAFESQGVAALLILFVMAATTASMILACSLLSSAFAKARRAHLMLDNLDSHFGKCLEDVLGRRAADKLLRCVQCHCTPKHAIWLNMPEIEIGILGRQCLDRRLADREALRREIDHWQLDHNATSRTIEWTFTRHDADR